MKKFFTSVAAACLAVAGVNAQSWQATGDVVAENSVLVDNEYAKVATANQDGTVYTLLDSESQPTTITLGDYSFTKAVNIRVTDAPSKDNPTGTAQHCPNCGNAVDPAWKFCHFCGNKLF